MPTSHTRVTIYNRALDLVNEIPVNTPTDQSSYARWLNRNYEHTVEASLRQQPWNFACRFWLPTAGATVPLMRWSRRYELPAGWLRVLQPTKDGVRDGYPLPYAVQGNYLMMNDAPTKGVELVTNIQNPGEWDPLFADLIAARLGIGLAHRFTAKNSFVDRCKEAAQEAYEQAELINTFEGTAARTEEHDIVRARGGDYRGTDRRGGGPMSEWL